MEHGETSPCMHSWVSELTGSVCVMGEPALDSQAAVPIVGLLTVADGEKA